MQSGAWKKIAVPSCWELQGFGVYNYGQVFRPRKGEPFTSPPRFCIGTGQIQDRFHRSGRWQGRVVRIVFEGVMVRTEVFIIGGSAGLADEGGFCEFKYDIARDS